RSAATVVTVRTTQAATKPRASPAATSATVSHDSDEITGGPPREPNRGRSSYEHRFALRPPDYLRSAPSASVGCMRCILHARQYAQETVYFGPTALHPEPVGEVDAGVGREVVVLVRPVLGRARDEGRPHPLAGGGMEIVVVRRDQQDAVRRRSEQIDGA